MNDPFPSQIPGNAFTAGELLVEAERRARRLLGRTSPAVGATLVAGWPALLRAATEVLDPHDAYRHLGEAYQATRPDPVLGAAAVVDRMSLETDAVAGLAMPTITHPGLQLIADSWQHAAALLRRPASTSRPGDPAVDLRVVSTLTVVAHVTQVSLRGRPPRPLEPAEAERFRRMAQRHEQLGIRCLRQMSGPDPTRPKPSAEHPSTVSAAGALLLGLKQWAPLATAVAANPMSSVQDLRRIAEAEQVSTKCAAILVAAAAERGELPAEAVGHLQHRLGTLSEHWHQVAEQYGWVRRFSSAARTPQIRGVSADLTTSLVDATHNQPGEDGRRTRADAATVAGRFADTALIPVLRGLTENSAILAELFQRIPTRPYRRDEQGQLRPVFGAPEQILRQLSRQQYAQTWDAGKSDNLESANALDVPVTATGNTVMPMTAPATAVLRAAGLDLARAASSAEQALDVATDPLGRRLGSGPPTPLAALPARPAPSPAHLPPNPGGIPR